jgi:hypothetical protein
MSKDIFLILFSMSTLVFSCFCVFSYGTFNIKNIFNKEKWVYVFALYFPLNIFLIDLFDNSYLSFFIIIPMFVLFAIFVSAMIDRLK